MDNSKDELAFAYVMGLLESDEIRAVEKQMTDDATLVSIVDYWQQTLPELDNALVPQTPPKIVWNNIKKQISPKQAFFNFGSWLKPSYVTAFASLMMLALVSIFLLQNPYQKVEFEDKWMVKANMNDGMLTLVALNPPHMTKDKVCNLWIKDKQNQMMKVGELPMNNKKTMDLKSHKALYEMFQDKAMLMISVDKAGTSPVAPEKVMYEVAWLKS